MLDKGTFVWFPDPISGWLPARVERLDAEGVLLMVNSTQEVRAKSLDGLLRIEGTHVDGVADMTDLSDLNEPSVLHNLRVRYERDQIYTYTGSILIAINPYKTLPIYDDAAVARYRNQPLGVQDPHIFAIADQAYSNMLRDRANQSIIISGESGAGKTESTKLLLRYIVAASPGKSPIEEQILNANPLLESFGNAKTVRNDNSSRFGRLMQVQFDNNAHIIGAKVTHYLLEKSRVTHQAKSERNFHVFYQLCRGATDDERARFQLLNVDEYHYLSQSGCTTVPASDKAEYGHLRAAMGSVGLSDDEQDAVFRVLAGILRLGNIEFEQCDQEDEACVIVPSSHLAATAELLGCDPEEMRSALTKRNICVVGQTFVKPLTVENARESRDSLARSLYAQLFDYVVTIINFKMCVPHSATFIGVLDIFGFEIFETNTLDQLCINFANEKLQQHFNTHIFKQEQAQYESEGIDWTSIDFKDNAECLALFETRPSGLISLLDEECRLPKGTDLTLLEKYKAKFKAHPSYVSKKAKMGPLSFGVEHYAGLVEYTADGFLTKNKEVLRQDLQQLLLESSNHFVAGLMDSSSPLTKGHAHTKEHMLVNKELKTRLGGSTRERSSSDMGRGTRGTICTQFHAQLNQLMALLENTSPHYIRCLKPNSIKLQDKFQARLVLQQLRYSGIMECIRIRRVGYPYRMMPAGFINRFKLIIPREVFDNNKGASPRDLSRLALEALGVARDGWQIGKISLFLKEREYALLERSRDATLEQVALRIQLSYRTYVARSKFKKQRRSAIVVQSLFRGKRARDLKSRKQDEQKQAAAAAAAAAQAAQAAQAAELAAAKAAKAADAAAKASKASSPAESRGGTPFGSHRASAKPRRLTESGTLVCGRLWVKVVRGNGLAVKDLNGTSDPYCVLSIEGQPRHQEHRTFVAKRDLNPEWNSEFSFDITSDTAQLVLFVWDEDILTSDDFMGTASVSVRPDLEDGDMHSLLLPLEPRRGASSGRRRDRVQGTVEIKVQYTSLVGLDPAELAGYLAFAEALVRDAQAAKPERGGDLATVRAVCLGFEEKLEEMSRALITVFEYHSETRSLLYWAIFGEVRATTQEATLFRTDSLATRLMGAVCKTVGKDYIQAVLGPCVAQLAKGGPATFEIDPNRIDVGHELETNIGNLTRVCQLLIDSVISSLPSCPRILSETAYILYDVVERYFPEAGRVAIAGFFFLRFLSPALTNPGLYDLPCDGLLRPLILVAKVMQALANGIKFGDKERFMVPLNPLLDDNRARIRDFMDALKIVPHQAGLGVQGIMPTEQEVGRDARFLYRHLVENAEKAAKILDIDEAAVREGPGQVANALGTPTPTQDPAIAKALGLAAAAAAPAAQPTEPELPEPEPEAEPVQVPPTRKIEAPTGSARSNSTSSGSLEVPRAASGRPPRTPSPVGHRVMFSDTDSGGGSSKKSLPEPSPIPPQEGPTSTAQRVSSEREQELQRLKAVVGSNRSKELRARFEKVGGGGGGGGGGGDAAKPVITLAELKKRNESKGVKRHSMPADMVRSRTVAKIEVVTASAAGDGQASELENLRSMMKDKAAGRPISTVLEKGDFRMGAISAEDAELAELARPVPAEEIGEAHGGGSAKRKVPVGGVGCFGAAE